MNKFCDICGFIGRSGPPRIIASDWANDHLCIKCFLKKGEIVEKTKVNRAKEEQLENIATMIDLMERVSYQLELLVKNAALIHNATVDLVGDAKECNLNISKAALGLKAISMEATKPEEFNEAQNEQNEQNDQPDQAGQEKSKKILAYPMFLPAAGSVTERNDAILYFI